MVATFYVSKGSRYDWNRACLMVKGARKVGNDVS